MKEKREPFSVNPFDLKAERDKLESRLGMCRGTLGDPNDFRSPWCELPEGHEGPHGLLPVKE